MFANRRAGGKAGARFAIAAAIALGAILHGFSQESMAELNERYSFPVSVGAMYRDLQAFGGFPSGFSFREIGAELRVPLTQLPTFQPFVRAGTLSVLQAGSAGGSQFDHSQMWGALGLGYSTRFSRNFEIGIDAAGGIFQTAFPNLSPGTTVGELGYLAEAGARIGLVPSYNLSVDLRPAIRYSQSLGLLDDFDGLYFGLGFAVSWQKAADAARNMIDNTRILFMRRRFILWSVLVLGPHVVKEPERSRNFRHGHLVGKRRKRIRGQEGVPRGLVVRRDPGCPDDLEVLDPAVLH